jgi:hypothetical protein
MKGGRLTARSGCSPARDNASIYRGDKLRLLEETFGEKKPEELLKQCVGALRYGVNRKQALRDRA